MNMRKVATYLVVDDGKDAALAAFPMHWNYDLVEGIEQIRDEIVKLIENAEFD